jgi:hypothetical protein
MLSIAIRSATRSSLIMSTGVPSTYSHGCVSQAHWAKSQVHPELNDALGNAVSVDLSSFACSKFGSNGLCMNTLGHEVMTVAQRTNDLRRQCFVQGLTTTSILAP